MRDSGPGRRSLLSIVRGVFRGTRQDKMQRAQAEMYAGETREMEHAEPYGFTSVPHEGAEVIAAAPGGSRSHMVILCVADRRYRLQNLAAGEVAIHDDQGQVVHLTRDGMVLETPAGKSIALKCGSVGFTMTDAGVDFTGGYVRHNGVSIDDGHVHGGVTPGASDTSEPSN